MSPTDIDAIFKAANTVTTIILVVTISMGILGLLFRLDRMRQAPPPRPKARSGEKQPRFLSFEWLFIRLPPDKQAEIEKSARDEIRKNKLKEIDRLIDKIFTLPPAERAELKAIVDKMYRDEGHVPPPWPDDEP